MRSADATQVAAWAAQADRLWAAVFFRLPCLNAEAGAVRAARGCLEDEADRLRAEGRTPLVDDFDGGRLCRTCRIARHLELAERELRDEAESLGGAPKEVPGA